MPWPLRSCHEFATECKFLVHLQAPSPRPMGWSNIQKKASLPRSGSGRAKTMHRHNFFSWEDTGSSRWEPGPGSGGRAGHYRANTSPAPATRNEQPPKDTEAPGNVTAGKFKYLINPGIFFKLAAVVSRTVRGWRLVVHSILVFVRVNRGRRYLEDAQRRVVWSYIDLASNSIESCR